MKIPKEIKFMGCRYQISEVTHLDNGDAWGRTDLNRNKIFLESEIPEDLKQEVLIHELMHVAYKHTSNILTDEQEESVISPWSANIYGILKDNNLLRD